jgi:hypothetical protein
MIANALRLAYDAIHDTRAELRTIQRAALQLAEDYPHEPDTVALWLDLAGDAWTADKDTADLLEADNLEPDEVGQWLTRAELIKDRARALIP